MKRLPLDHTEQERTLLRRIEATPTDEVRALFKSLHDDELYAAQTAVYAVSERHVERDVEIKRQLDAVVRWRFPRGWPSPASAISAGSEPDA